MVQLNGSGKLIAMRTTKQDWLFEGLTLIAEEGVAALTIDAVMQRLGVTKGSFYHHFKNIQDYKEQLLLFFEQQGTLNIIELVQHASSASEKLHQLRELIIAGPSKLEVVMRGWAVQDELVRTVNERVDAQRFSFVRELSKALLAEGSVEPSKAFKSAEDQAEMMAQVMFALYIGARQMLPPLEGDAIRRLFVEFQRVYAIKNP
jgi:AcrR family transcriptional regulator